MSECPCGKFYCLRPSGFSRANNGLLLDVRLELDAASKETHLLNCSFGEQIFEDVLYCSPSAGLGEAFDEPDGYGGVDAVHVRRVRGIL